MPEIEIPKDQPETLPENPKILETPQQNKEENLPNIASPSPNAANNVFN